MAATPEEIRLIEKMVRAKVALEGGKSSHSSNCMTDMDPEYRGPCTCGADMHNSVISAALKELSL